jgi:hypothetical protein
MPERTWQCVSCKHTNPPYTEVCRECGVLPDGTKFTAYQWGAEKAATMQSDDASEPTRVPIVSSISYTGPTPEEADRWALLIPLLATLWNQAKAKECDGQINSVVVREVSGLLGKFQISYYIPGERRNWVVFSCGGKGGCKNPLKGQFESSLGKPARAGFCNGQLLWVELQGERVFTRDNAFNPALLMVGIVIFVMIIFYLVSFTGRSKDHI